MESKNTRPTFPWYKERLQNKYLKDPTKKLSLDCSRWRLLNAEHEDFRDCGPILPEGQSGVSPVIFHGTPTRTPGRVQKKRFSKEKVCFSKQMIQKQIRREYVAAVEKKLRQHPLTQYQYYKECMDPELFDKVVSVLDPDACVNGASAIPTLAAEHAEEEDTENCTKPNKEEVEGAKQEMSANENSLDIQKRIHRKSYMLQINGNGNEEDQRANATQLNSMFQDEDVREIVERFRDSFASLGEENNMIDSDTLGHSDSGLQTEKDADFEPNKMNPGTNEHKYGAQYLHPSIWKKKTSRDGSRKFDFQSQTSEKSNLLPDKNQNVPRGEKRGTSDTPGFVSEYKGNKNK